MKNKTYVKSYVELAGAGAVLVGLIFVGLELRQNTSAVEAATLQNLTDASGEYLMTLATNPELARILYEGSTNMEQLSASDRRQHHYLMRAQWFRFQNSFLQWQRGTLNDDAWEIYAGFVCRTAVGGPPNEAGPSNRVATWADHRPILLPHFVEYVEACWAGDTPQQ
jgi:hypothetical protein